MTMSTQTLAEAGRLFEENVFIDTVQILDVGEPITTGTQVTRSLTEVGEPISGLVQSVSLENALEGRVNQLYSVKVPRHTGLSEGQAVRVISCEAEPDLVGRVILLDTVSHNGLSTMRKGTGQISVTVNQEGKEALL